MVILSAWNTFIVTPLTNYLVALAALAGGSYGIGILLLTVSTRVATFPLTLRSLRVSRRLRELQPKLRQLQSGEQDPATRAKAQQELLRAEGVNPLGCLGPQLVQMPIFIAVNRVVRLTLAASPAAAQSLSSRLYPISAIRHAVPLNTRFFALDLAKPGGAWLALAIFGLQVAQQWLGRTSTERGNAASTLLLPVAVAALFASFVMRAPAGLGLYWGTSVLIGIALQEAFFHQRLRGLFSVPAPAPASPAVSLEAAMPSSTPAEAPSPSRPDAPTPRPTSRKQRSRERRRRRM